MLSKNACDLIFFLKFQITYKTMQKHQYVVTLPTIIQFSASMPKIITAYILLYFSLFIFIQCLMDCQQALGTCKRE